MLCVKFSRYSPYHQSAASSYISTDGSAGDGYGGGGYDSHSPNGYPQCSTAIVNGNGVASYHSPTPELGTRPDAVDEQANILQNLGCISKVVFTVF